MGEGIILSKYFFTLDFLPEMCVERDYMKELYLNKYLD